MSRTGPLNYTGRVEASLERAGDCYFDGSDFVVASDGKVSLITTATATTSAAGLVELATDAEAQAKSASTVITAGNLAAEGFLQWEDVTLTSAQVKALAATQIELVAAQGAGSIIQFMGATLKLNYGGSNAFTETADNLVIKYTDASGVAVSDVIENTGFIDQTADTYTFAVPVKDPIVAASAGENAALVLDNNGDGEIAGNAANDNTLTVRVYYVVHSL